MLGKPVSFTRVILRAGSTVAVVGLTTRLLISAAPVVIVVELTSPLTVKILLA